MPVSCMSCLIDLVESDGVHAYPCAFREVKRDPRALANDRALAEALIAKRAISM